MAQEPLSRVLRPQMLKATLSNLQAQRAALSIRRDLKVEAGQSASSEEAELEKLDVEIESTRKQIESP